MIPLPAFRSIRPLSLTVFAVAALASSLSAAPFKDFVIFGDSLSDVGNIAHRTEDDLDIRYPSPDFGYTDGRFTDGKDTDPAVRQRKGVWHEQLAINYFGQKKTTATLDSSTGQDYAFGGAKTTAGASKRSVFEDPIFGNEIEITIDDMGKQVDDYIAGHHPDPNTLFILWGGANDFLDSQDPATATAAAANIHGYMVRLAQVGATNFLVVNEPPIGMVPNYSGRGNSDALNQVCAQYATELFASVDAAKAELAAQGIAVNVYKLDVYNLFLRYLQNASAYGFVDVTHLAQGEDVNPDKYLFWDGLHPTTRGHALIAAEAFTALTGSPVVSINTVDSAIAENGGKGTYYLTRTGVDLSASLTVPLTPSGEATVGVDYKAPKSAKVIKPGKAIATMQTKAFDDSSKEGDEDFTLTIGAGSGYTVGFPKNATITISDND